MSKYHSDAIAARLQGAGVNGITNVLSALLPVGVGDSDDIKGMPQSTVHAFWADYFTHRMPTITRFEGSLTDVFGVIELEQFGSGQPVVAHLAGATQAVRGPMNVWRSHGTMPNTYFLPRVADHPFFADKGGDGFGAGCMIQRYTSPGRVFGVTHGDIANAVPLCVTGQQNNQFGLDGCEFRLGAAEPGGGLDINAWGGNTNLGVLLAMADPGASDLQLGISWKQSSPTAGLATVHGYAGAVEGSIVDSAIAWATPTAPPWNPVFMARRTRGYDGTFATGHDIYQPMSVHMTHFGNFIVARRYIDVADWQKLNTVNAAKAPALRQEPGRIARIVQGFSINQTSQLLQDIEGGYDPQPETDDQIKRRYTTA